MIDTNFRTALTEYPDKPFIVSASGAWSYAEFYKYVRQIAGTLNQLEPGRLACHLPDSPQLIAVIFAAALTERSLVLFNHDYTPAQVEPLLQLTEATFLISDCEGFSDAHCKTLNPDSFLTEADDQALPENTSPANSEILILTSGTTGQPKCALYTWGNLFAQVKMSHANNDERWLLAYRLNHFAGIQMIAHVLCNGSTLVLAKTHQVADSITAMIDFQVTHVSSTPTFWRFALALLHANKDALRLKHLTLGSEAAPGDLLDQLHDLFPDARIIHIYASTEAGSCISVSDMKPGLPVAVLQRPADAEIQFRIVEDELQIKSLNGMRSYLGSDTTTDNVATAPEWRASGDLVRIEDERIIFVGRKNETINVGGVKIHPLDVENLVSPLDGVKLVRAYGQKNPIVGHIVAIDVVCDEGYDPDTIEARIRTACEKLVPAARPRSINIVDAILTNNMKLSRH